jgi:inorganic pyrophosphatase
LETSVVKNLWHDVANIDHLIGVVEIPMGSKHKYELDKTTGGLILDRVISRAMPANYGFIPRTLSEDGDPLDVYILQDDPIQPLTQVKLKIMGIILMTDNGENDEKLVCSVEGDPWSKAVPFDLNVDGDFICAFLTNYKKGIKVKKVCGPAEALRVLAECQKRYQEKYSGVRV